MNNPSPLVPQGSLLEQKNKSRARVRLAVFSVLAVHVVGLMALLITQGCKREQQQPVSPTPLPASDTNLPPVGLTNTPPPAVVLTNIPPVAEHPTLPATTSEYTVVAGDNFTTIAKKYPGVTVKAIQEANPNVNPLKLQPKMKLVIPAPTAAPAGGTGGGTALVPSSGEQIYEVKSGDTLTTIASRHGIKLAELRAANPQLTTDRIKVGDKLKIPAKAVAPAEAPAPLTTPTPIVSNTPSLPR